MPTTNQRNRSGGQKGQPGGQGQQGIQSAVQKASSQASNKLAEVRDEVSGYMSQGYQQVGQMTRGHEGQAALVALAAGFGIGFVIGCSLVSSSRRPKRWRDRMIPEGLGQKIMERVDRMIPEAIAEHLHR